MIRCFENVISESLKESGLFSPRKRRLNREYDNRLLICKRSLERSCSVLQSGQE